MAITFKTSELITLSIALGAQINQTNRSIRSVNNERLLMFYKSSLKEAERLRREIQAEITLRQRDGDFD